MMPLYSLWTGFKDSLNEYKNMYTDGDIEYFQHLAKHDIIETYFTNPEDGTHTAKITIPKETCPSLSHITGYITCYQATQVLEQLMKIEYDRVARVVVDGIYTTEPVKELMPTFRPKTDIKLGNDACPSYFSFRPSTVNKQLLDSTPYKDNYQRELHVGPGGCGKTHSQLNDKGVINTLYLAPTYKLARSKQEETDIPCMVWNENAFRSLLHKNPLEYLFINKFNVLLIDECSMLTEANKRLIFTRYPYHKILMLGDDKQELPIYGNQMNFKTRFNKIIEYTNDYRSIDDKTKEFKEFMRSLSFENNYWEYKSSVIKKFMEYLPGHIVNMDYLIDLILSTTNEQKDAYTEKLKERDFGGFQKYKITNNTKTFSNGQIVITDNTESMDNEKAKYQIQHAFTIYSIQGDTCKNPNILYIDIERLNDPHTIYTAFARCQSINQIYLINGDTLRKTGYIYKITSSTGYYYIGSTKYTIESRFNQHKQDYINGVLDCTSKRVFDNHLKKYKSLNGVKIHLLETVKIESPKSGVPSALSDLVNRETTTIQRHIKDRFCVNKQLFNKTGD